MSPFRLDYVELEFHNDFVMWMIMANFHGTFCCDLLCNGWEL